ncbi:MAG: NADPH:quinone reductase-like Zn-dependent oxidoreductase [Gammaproteobacteria bacterium]|jgi:NADPH:quinone reductase-like Zn-dependent oxidoreductase
MKAYQITSDGGVDALSLTELDVPKPGPREVLVRVRASSINYRDLSTIENPVPRGVPFPRIPNSDGAGEVVEVGSEVTRFKSGERVCGSFFQDWIDGELTELDTQKMLGGTAEGMLAEYRVLPERGLVHTPAYLSDVEAATLPCAALTAWNSMVETGGVTAGSTVLLLGTGGVSVIAQQLCNLLGARTVVTSSSDEKLDRIRKLGAWETINYRSTPDWDRMVLDVTEGRGVDHTVEVGGAGTLQKSMNATRFSGSLGIIGILTGGEIDPLAILRRSLKLRGIYVGSRRMFENMNAALEAHQLRPVVDGTYAFEDARQAYHDMRAANHFGKLVITV